MSAKLKPCPFCGGLLGIGTDKSGHADDCYILLLLRKRGDPATIEEAWNRRATPATAELVEGERERADEAARLRRVANLLGMQREVPEDDGTLRGCLFAVLGQIARKLEQERASRDQQPAGVHGGAALPPPELTWLYTHCRAIGMTCKSDSGKWEHDIALFTINQKQEIADLRAQLACHIQVERSIGG